MLVQAAAAAMAGRSGQLHDGERRGHPSGERAQALLWRAGRRREQRRRRQRTSPLKDPKDFVLIGKPLKRLDTPDKVNGKAVYGIDAMLPGMKFATLAQCPVFGGKVGKVDDSAAKKIPGRAADRGARRSGRGGRRSHVGGQERPRRARIVTWDEGPNAKHQLERHLGRSARGQREGRRGREIRRRHRQGPCDRREARGVVSNCRFSRMPRWSR